MSIVGIRNISFIGKWSSIIPGVISKENNLNNLTQ